MNAVVLALDVTNISIINGRNGCGLAAAPLIGNDGSSIASFHRNSFNATLAGNSETIGNCWPSLNHGLNSKATVFGVGIHIMHFLGSHGIPGGILVVRLYAVSAVVPTPLSKLNPL